MNDERLTQIGLDTAKHIPVGSQTIMELVHAVRMHRKERDTLAGRLNVINEKKENNMKDKDLIITGTVGGIVLALAFIGICLMWGWGTMFLSIVGTVFVTVLGVAGFGITASFVQDRKKQRR